MWWLEWLMRLFRKAPGPVTNVRIQVTPMKEIKVEWSLPTVRVDGSAMPATEIDYTEALFSTDAGKTFVSLGKVEPDAVQIVNRAPAPDGQYVVRLIAVGVNGKKGPPVDTPVVVDTPAPGTVTAVKVSVL